MISIFKIKNTVFIFLFLCFSCFSQNLKLSPKSRISIITCETGNESYSLFGHTAIRISDPKYNLDLVYNYGSFDFNTPNFVAKFAKGDLQYYAIGEYFSNFISQYSYEQRTVLEQVLDIPLELKQKLFDNLNHVLSTNESFYTYKFVDKNCTSMVVDILNKTLGAEIIVKAPTTLSDRSVLYPYFNNFFLEQLGTSCIFGSKVDIKSKHIYLPLELYECLKNTKFKNKLLCVESVKILDFEKANPISWWNNFIVFLVLIALLIILNKQIVNNLYFLIMGLLGVFFFFMHFYSNHKELHYNYNTLLFNPLFLILLYFIIIKNKKWIANIALLIIGMTIIYFLIVVNKAYFMIISPLIFLNTFLLIKMFMNNYNGRIGNFILKKNI